MAITFISRDYGVNVSIVRITTTDTTGVASAPGYITAQAINIELANNGPFSWQIGDEVLLQASNANAFFEISNDFTSLIGNETFYAVQAGIVAHPGGGQALATQLFSGINNISGATAADSVILPSNVLGKTVIISNVGTVSLNVYPGVGATLDNNTANMPEPLAAQATVVYYGASATNWRSI